MTRFDKLLKNVSKTQPVEKDEDSQTIAEPASKEKKKRGKRNDPNYTQVTAYIRKDTHHRVKLALLQEGGDREFSELVEGLLVEYLRTQTSNNSSR